MSKKIKYDVIMFDLFFTLVEPRYLKVNNEFDILGITEEMWEKYAEQGDLYVKRIEGQVKDETKVIEAILLALNIEFDDHLIDEVLKARLSRFSKCLKEVNPDILEALTALKAQNIKLVLVSNADVIDIKYWSESPLSKLFDDVFFSCQVGLIKPNPDFYDYMLKTKNLKAEQCLFIGDGGDDELLGALHAGFDVAQATYFYDRKNLDYSDSIKVKIEDTGEIVSVLLGLN